MWPYSADENEWLSPLRPQPDLPPPDRPTSRIAAETKSAGEKPAGDKPADEQRAEALAAFKSSLLDGCRRPRVKH